MIMGKGKLYMLTREEYTDYHVVSLFRPNQDIDLEVLQNRYKDAKFPLDEFTTELLKFGEEVKSTEIHLGSYGEVRVTVYKEG